MTTSEHRDLLLEGLRQGMIERIAQIFQNLAQAGEPEAAHRFRNGVERSIVAYAEAQRIIENCTLESMGD
jgi:hypothetical protein